MTASDYRRLLLESIEELRKFRPVFHSEADFQFALAWQLGQQGGVPGSRIRLETSRINLDSDKSERLDLEFGTTEARYAVELKHLRRELKWPDQGGKAGEEFSLRTGARDVELYDTVKDIRRLENLLDSDSTWVGGSVIVVSNQALEWNQGPQGRYWDEFRLTEGRQLSGTLRWGDDRPQLGRADSITLRGSYAAHWRDWSQVPTDDKRSSQFRYLQIDIDRKV